MGSIPQQQNPRRAAIFAIVSLLIGVLIPLGLAEILLRFLPVNDGLMATAVNERSPIFHFAPDRDVLWSRDWNFTTVNRIRVNNAGYVNKQDYEAADPRPLCAVVGDSYVEAALVPPSDTLHGRLANLFAPHTRIYSFAASGAPLSQYLVWGREARERWKAEALAIVVVGNDFDESLAAYKVSPGFHHYVEGPNGSLVLRRFDYAPSGWRMLVSSSALGRYLVFNLQAVEHLRRLLAGRPSVGIPVRGEEEYVGNTVAVADKSRLDMSKAAADAFLKDLVAFAGWAPNQVVFVVDGIRYPSSDPLVLNSYYVQMRTHFMGAARSAGFEVVDMDEHFFPGFRALGQRFEFPTDGHWNGIGHAFAASALASTTTFARCAHSTIQSLAR